jgi:cell wall-associated NlpC family hydrolase
MPPLLRSLLLALAFVALGSGCGAPAREASTPATIKVAFTPLTAPRYVRRIEPTVGERAAKVAIQAVGVPYRWGGASPASGFDCSGLVHWAYARLGIELPHSSYALYNLGRQVARRKMKAGDLLFFYGLGHVGVYLGGGRMVHAPRSGRTVEVVRLAGSDYAAQIVGARRVVPG